MKKKKAYSYRRFSSGKQSKGSSIERQADEAAQFCKRHNLEQADTFTDAGVSAWKGKNLSPEFALGKFLELVQKNLIEKGSVLVLESQLACLRP
jgi:DNA invertase Pin-like site-specific DNA recombinase